MKKALTASVIILALIGTSTVAQAANAAPRNKVTTTKVATAKNSEKAAARKTARTEARAAAKAAGVTDKTAIKAAVKAAATSLKK